MNRENQQFFAALEQGLSRKVADKATYKSTTKLI